MDGFVHMRTTKDFERVDVIYRRIWEEIRQRLQTDPDPELLEMRQYTLDSPMIPTMPELRIYAEKSFPKERPLLEAVEDLTTRLHTDFTYDPNFTTIAWGRDYSDVTPLKGVVFGSGTHKLSVSVDCQRENF